MKQEKGTDTRIMQENSKTSEKDERGHEGEKFKQGLTSAKDLTIELPDGRESPYHRLDYNLTTNLCYYKTTRQP